MVDFKINTQEFIEVKYEDGSKSFLYQKDGEWVKITEEQYNNIIEGEKNG